MKILTYHKIDSIFKRDPDTHQFIDGDFSRPEFGLLKDIEWVWTEKIDGTNIRIIKPSFGAVEYRGREEYSSIPKPLRAKLESIFNPLFEDRTSVFEYEDGDVVLFGEGYGNKIQAVGDKYIPNDTDFILFDVMIDGLYLRRESVEDIAKTLGIGCVPIVGSGTLNEAIEFVSKGFASKLGNLKAEGVVARPAVELCDRFGHRIIVKIKTRDFR